MDNPVVIACPHCRRLLRIPSDRGTLNVTCPTCRAQFVWSPKMSSQPESTFTQVKKTGNWSRQRSALVVIGVLVGFALLYKYFNISNVTSDRSPSRSSPAKNEGQLPRQGGAPAWVKISYGDLVDRGTVTHSGQTVGNRLDEIAKSNRTLSESGFSDLQPYLEPFSFVCNDIVSAARPLDLKPYVNVVADYPSGARQPAWAALFREGHYQLFVGDGRARLFLKGENSARLFDQLQGVIRHPLKEVLEAAGTDKMTVEVYAFINDYTSRTISLDINPYVVDISHNQLVSGKKGLPLAGLAEFFNKGVTLEAAEIDDNGEFYLYGSPSSRQTVAGRPQSLEDFAVVYRSTFHHGGNAPYISLDRHEDNRYAKVNFGGFLEDTRVGSVVLEADKLFKTMSTGLDPNTRAYIKGKIQITVPDFVTEDERSQRDGEKGSMQIRYWFYPDKIQTVTDGRIGAVKSCQFLAEAERMDQKLTLGRAQRETIDHLNNYFGQYAQAFSTYQELNNVGRMMAIVNWLQQSDIITQVDLDALLSVELSAFNTQRRTKKLLAVTAPSYSDIGPEGGSDVRQKVYCLDSLLEGMNASISDKGMLDVASERFSKIKRSENVAQARIVKMQAKLKSLGSTIERGRMTLDRANEYEINRFNAMVEEYNSLKAIYNDAVDSYNQSIRRLRSVGYQSHYLVSVGGGINLRPKDFAKPIRMPDSPLIQRIRRTRETIHSSPGSTGEMTRSTSRRSTETIVPKRSQKPWKTTGERTAGEITRKQWSNGGQGSMTVEANPTTGYTRYRMATKGYFSETTVKPGRSEVVLSNSAYPREIVATGNFSQGGTIVLHKGKNIGAQKSQRNTD